MVNPFPKLTAEAQRHPENKRLLDELGACLVSLAKPRTHSKRYDFYEVLDDEERERQETASD